MTEPTKHSKSGAYRVRLTIPGNLRATAQQLYGVGREFTANLNTRDKRDALARAPAALAKLQAQLALVRSMHSVGPRTLSHREVRAVAGEWYKAAVGLNEDTPGDHGAWDAYRDDLFSAREFPDGDPEGGALPDYAPDHHALAEARRILGERGIVAAEPSVEAFAKALWEVRLNLGALMMRRAAGDYGPDHFTNKLPPLPALTSAPDFGPAVTFDSIVRGWAMDAGHNPDAEPIPRAYYDRAKTADRLAAFLGHQRVSDVSKGDAVRWKEGMQERGLTAATVANDISEMSAVWRWAARHGKATENPFAGILPPKKSRNRKATRRPFTEAEAALILSAARKESGALRWLPWVLAATGARLSEVCQATKDDIVIRDALPFLRIHADTDDDREAGEAQRSVKNEGSERFVPVHSALEAEGFLAYAAALPAGSSLFPDIKPDRMFGSRGNSAQKIIGRWLRHKLKIADAKISPAHSWRHWWIDQARAVGMHPEVRNAITGHVDDGNESHRYGLGWKAQPRALSDAMASIELPKIELDRG